MIEKTRKTTGLKESRKDYYVVLCDGCPIGVISSGEFVAEGCLAELAEKRNAARINSSIWKYYDESGEHLLWVKKVKRLKIR